MVLLWRADDGSAGSPLSFDGLQSSDVNKLFFVYEKFVMRGKTDEEKATNLLCHVEGDSFEIYYDAFAKNGAITAEGKNYAVLKNIFIDQYAPVKGPEDVIRDVMSAWLSMDDL